MISFSILSIILICLAGIALDWAFFDGFVNVMGVFFPLNWEVRYRDYLGLRAVPLLMGMIVFLAGASEQYRNIWLSVAGGGIFLLASLFGCLSVFLKHRPVK